jgi:hypothetical protein
VTRVYIVSRATPGGGLYPARAFATQAEAEDYVSRMLLVSMLCADDFDISEIPFGASV